MLFLNLMRDILSDDEQEHEQELLTDGGAQPGGQPLRGRTVVECISLAKVQVKKLPEGDGGAYLE